MLGLDAAGKTTILYKLHIGEILSTVPTIGEYITASPISCKHSSRQSALIVLECLWALLNACQGFVHM